MQFGRKMLKFIAILLVCCGCQGHSYSIETSTRWCALGVFNNTPVNNCSLPICEASTTGLPVPVEACDNSKCVDVPLEELRKVTALKAYTWNIGKFWDVGYCPYFDSVDLIENDDGTVTYRELDSSATGLNCSVVTHYIFEFPTPSHPSNGNYKTTIQRIGLNETWEECFLLFVPGGPRIARRCRVDPPPPAGQGIARILVFKSAEGDCSKDEGILNSYLNNYLVDWKRITLQCY